MTAKRVLVTGSSRGIGKAIAVRLAVEGYDIAVHCRLNVDAARETAEAVEAAGRKARVLVFDIADREGALRAIEDDLAQGGPYFGVVCNAGLTSDGIFAGLTGEAWDAVIAANLGGFYNVLQPIMLPLLSSKMKGGIVTISSIAGQTGNRGQANYAAAKAGIIGATKSLAREVAKRGITVNCVAPGLIESDMTANLPARDQLLERIPLGRFGEPGEVAALVAFLFSDSAAYITGQVISVNGGMV